jgi:DNA-binding SARP family transcriptional activator
VVRGRLLSGIFEVTPAGILVVAADGGVLTWNPALADLVGDVVERARTCCDVFGCGTPDSPLAGICLTELALAGATPPAGVVFEPAGRPGTGIAVEASPFRVGDAAHVVFDVRRSGVGVDTRIPATRRERTTPKIRIQALGETVVETAGAELRGDWLDQRAGHLLKFLVAKRYTPVHADVIAETLWPHARTETTNTVRHFVHELREKLEPERARYERSSFVLARNGGYVLNRESISVDADEFESEAKAGLIAHAAGEHEAAVTRLRRAVELYHGEFMDEEHFEDWAVAERERLRDLATKALRILADLTDDPAEAAGYLEAVAAMEPLDVDIHRDLITVWLRQGRRGRAIRHYRTLQSRLMRELGERLNFDLSELARLRP